jgi:hypothetical protein
MIALPIDSSEVGSVLVVVCHLGKVLLEHGGPAYGLVNQLIAGCEDRNTWHQFVPDQMKYFGDLRPLYTELLANCFAVFPASAFVRAWMYPDAIVAITRVTTASSLADVLKQSDRSQMAKLDMHARYPSLFQLRFQAFLFCFVIQPTYRMSSGTPIQPDSYRLWKNLLSDQVLFQVVSLEVEFDKFDFSELVG